MKATWYRPVLYFSQDSIEEVKVVDETDKFLIVPFNGPVKTRKVAKHSDGWHHYRTRIEAIEYMRGYREKEVTDAENKLKLAKKKLATFRNQYDPPKTAP